MTEKSFECDWKPYVHAIGRPNGALKAFLSPLMPLNINKGSQSVKNVSAAPLAISCHNGIMTVIDQKGSLWIVGNVFCEPVNLSDLIRVKAKRVFLGEGQLIFESKRKGAILITWASKPEFKVQKLRRLVVSHSTYSHLIDAFALDQDIEEGCLWYYSTVKRLQNTVKLYQLNVIGQQLLGLPTGKRIQIPDRPAGVSLGKYHGLIWTQDGRLYSWGCKNLALGLNQYKKSFYEQLQEIFLPETVIKAFASTSYSLALGSSGTVYEWGIQADGQPLLKPQVLRLKDLKFVDIKGYQTIFGGLTSTNELYLWGKGLGELLQINENVDEPFIIEKQEGVKIQDFLIQEDYILIILSENKGILSCQQRQYFNEVLKKVSAKWLPQRLLSKTTKKLSFVRQTKQNKIITAVCTPDFTKQGEDYIDRLIDQKISKQNYIGSIRDQQTLFRNIMTPNTQHVLKTKGYQPLRSSRQISAKQTKNKILHKKHSSARITIKNTFDEENAAKLINQFQNEQKRVRSAAKKALMPPNTKTHKLYSYEERKNAAAQRKIMLERKKYEQSTFKKRSTHKSAQIKVSEISPEVQNLHNIFKQQFIAKMMLHPLQIAKKIKQKQKTNEKLFDRVTCNMKNILYRQRASNLLKNLALYRPEKYYLVKKVFIRAIRRWRKQKLSKNRQIMVSTLLKHSLNQRLKCGLGNVWLNVRKIQKVCKWLTSERQERLMQLRCQWKRSLLLLVKPTPSFQNKNPTACREELSLKPPIEKAKVPKLIQVIKKSPLCSYRLPFPVPLQSLQKIKEYSKQQDMLLGYSSIPLTRRNVSWAENSRPEWRNETFTRLNDRKSTHNEGLIDIMLYSYHYDCFFKPKNCQINIPDNMKHSQKWIIQQRKIFIKILKDIIYQQWRNFYRQRKQYDFKLAIFIKDNYDKLAQNRWKYILEFNKLKTSHSTHSQKAQKQLKRLIELAGAETLLCNDVIPEKHRILDYVSSLKGAPVPPSFQIQFGNQIFKKKFKLYYETVLNRAKYFRKYFLIDK